MRHLGRIGLVFLLLCVMVSAGLAEAPEGTAGDELRIYFLDLGRVDGILIQCGGETAFIDVGYVSSAEKATGLLEALGVHKLNWYIGTHAHKDHIGGAGLMIHNFQADKLVVPQIKVKGAILSHASEEQAAYVSQMETVVMDVGDYIQVGDARLDCIGPLSFVDCSYGDTKENANSMILKLTYGARTVLLTGDATDNALRAVEKSNPGILKADVLKNPHHNSAHKAEVLELIGAEAVVVLTGNKYPISEKYRKLLVKKNMEVFVTGSKHQGHILLKSDGESLEFYTGYAVESLAFDEVSIKLARGEKRAVTGTVVPARANVQNWLRWTSTDESVVRVSKGVLLGVSEGTAVITAESINGVKAIATVQVVDALVVLDQTELEMAIGDEVKLRVKIVPKGTTGYTGRWYSEDTTVAVVTDKGEVLGSGAGETEIVAELSNGEQARCRVKVKAIEVEKVKLSASNLHLTFAARYQLTAQALPEDAFDKALEWRSSDESVVTVDQEGNIAVVGAGTAYVGAFASNGVYGKCKITVQENW